MLESVAIFLPETMGHQGKA